MSKFVKFVNIARKLQEAKHTMPMRVPFLEVHKLNSRPPPIIEHSANKIRKVDLAKEFNIKVGDLVQVMYGPDMGKQGVVLEILGDKNRLIVEGCSMKNTFFNPNRGAADPTVLTAESYMHVTNVALVDPILKKPTLVKERKMLNGEIVRICKLSGAALPDPVEPEKLKTARAELELSRVAADLKALGKQAQKYTISDEDDKRAFAAMVTWAKTSEKLGTANAFSAETLGETTGVNHVWRRDFTPYTEIVRQGKMAIKMETRHAKTTPYF